MTPGFLARLGIQAVRLRPFDISFDISWGGQPWTTLDKREPVVV